MRNPLIVGRRVYLRPIETTDAATTARWSAEEAETFWDSGRQPNSPLADEAFFKSVYEKDPPKDILLASCLKDGDELIGFLGIDGIDWVNRTGETHSYFGRAEHRGRGLGTESKLLLLDYAFNTLNLHVLQSWVFEPNERSWRALAKQGYQPAGRIRAHWLKNGVFRDVLCFDVMRDEWLAAKRAWEASFRE